MYIVAPPSNTQAMSGVLPYGERPSKFNSQGETKLSRRYIHIHELWHMTIHVWLFSPDGQIILQQRSKNKTNNPGCYCISVGGHVDADDVQWDHGYEFEIAYLE